MQGLIPDAIPRVLTSCETMECSVTAALMAARCSLWPGAAGKIVVAVSRVAATNSFAEITLTFLRAPAT